MEALAGNRSPHSMRSLLFGNDSFPPAALPESKPWWINSFPTTWPSSRYFTRRKGWFLLQKGSRWGAAAAAVHGKGLLWGFAPFAQHSCESCCRHDVGVCNPSSCPGRWLHLLCAPLAQEGLVHSLKEINYFCYLKKKSFGVGQLNFQTFIHVHIAVKQIYA